MIFEHYEAFDMFMQLDFDLPESIPKCKIILNLYDSWTSQLKAKLSGDMNMTVSTFFNFLFLVVIKPLTHWASSFLARRLFLVKLWMLCWD